MSINTINTETANIIADLLKELSSELDLHYEQDDFFALAPAFERMQRAANALEQAGYSPPASYHHVLRRFQRSQQ